MANVLEHRHGNQIQDDALGLCFCIGFFQKPASTFRADALAAGIRALTDYTPALEKLLRTSGYGFWRNGRGDHEIWRNDATGQKVVVDHAIKSRHTANGVLKQAGLRKAF